MCQLCFIVSDTVYEYTPHRPVFDHLHTYAKKEGEGLVHEVCKTTVKSGYYAPVPIFKISSQNGC